jgi:hypothetical protein
MDASQSERAQAFRALHERPGAFVIPNPWDVGTARILASTNSPTASTGPAPSSRASSNASRPSKTLRGKTGAGLCIAAELAAESPDWAPWELPPKPWYTRWHLMQLDERKACWAEVRANRPKSMPEYRRWLFNC